MRCFSEIKYVLDELYTRIPSEEECKDMVIEYELGKLRGDYQALIAGARIDYRDPFRRFAYFYRYVGAHADALYQIMCKIACKTDLLDRAFDKNSLSVSCLGGGPGSDTLGITKFMDELGKSTLLFCDVYDRERGWSDFWNRSKMPKKFKAWHGVFSSFQVMDVSCAKTWNDCYNLRYADLITMSFFMSEVYSTRNQANSFFEGLFKNAKNGAMFLFIDNSSGKSHEWFDELIKVHNQSKDRSPIHVLDCANGLDICCEEDARYLGIYYEKFKKERPRKKVYTNYRFCYKC